MLRLVLFFVGIFVLMGVLARIPVVGAVFRIPFLGFWVTALLVSVLSAKLAADALDRRKRSALVRRLGAVDTPHNKGKLGSLYAAQRRWKRAVPFLEQAAAGEPDNAEWHYRLGTALLGAGRPVDARSALERSVRLDEGHAYGQALLRLAQTCSSAGDHEAALATLERFERNHGPSPESVYRRGHALQRLGRGDASKAAFAEVGRLARQCSPYQRREAFTWARRAFLARCFGLVGRQA